MEYFDPKSLMTDKMIESGDFQDIIEDLTDIIPLDIAETLMKEQCDPDNVLLIHRTSRATAKMIFENGLVVAGGNDLNYTTSRCASKLSLMINIAGASGYKNPDGRPSRVIVIKLPKTAIRYEPGLTKPILQITNNTAEQSGGFMVVKGKYQTKLLPEYILGSIEYRNNEIVEYVRNPGYKSIHNHSNDGLICTEEAILSYIYQNEEALKGLEFDEKEKIANKQMIEENTKMFPSVFRSEDDIKQYALKDLVLSHVKEAIKRLFHKDKDEGDIEK